MSCDSLPGGVGAARFKFLIHTRLQPGGCAGQEQELLNRDRNWAHSTEGRELPSPQLSPEVKWVPSSSIGYGSQSPPMIPDGRFSRIRFEAAAYTMRLPTGGVEFKSMVDVHSFNLKFTHSLASRWDYRLLPAQRPAACPGQTRTTCPEVLGSRGITPLSSLLRPHVPVPKPLTNCAFTLVGQSLQFGPSTAGLLDLPDVTFRESFPGCLDLYSGSL